MKKFITWSDRHNVFKINEVISTTPDNMKPFSSRLFWINHYPHLDWYVVLEVKKSNNPFSYQRYYKVIGKA